MACLGPHKTKERIKKYNKYRRTCKLILSRGLVWLGDDASCFARTQPPIVNSFYVINGCNVTMNISVQNECRFWFFSTNFNKKNKLNRPTSSRNILI